MKPLRSRIHVERLEDRVTPSFATSLQTLVAQANQFTTLGSTVASTVGLLDNLPMFSQNLDQIFSQRASFTALSSVLKQVNATSIADRFELQARFDQLAPGQFLVDTFAPDPSRIDITYQKALSPANVTVASDFVDFTGGNQSYFTQVDVSGSGTLNFSSDTPIQIAFGVDSMGLFLKEGNLFHGGDVGGIAQLTGTAKVGQNIFDVKLNGSAYLAIEDASIGVNNHNGTPGETIRFSEVPSLLEFDHEGDGSGVGLIASASAQVFGIELLRWGTESLDLNQALLSYTLDDNSRFSTPATVKVGTPTYTSDNLIRDVESRLFSFATDNMLGLKDLNLPFFDALNVVDLDKIQELQRLITLVQIGLGNGLSGVGSNFEKGGESVPDQDNGFDISTFDTTSSRDSSSSPFHFQTDLNELIRFANGENVDLLWYDYEGSGEHYSNEAEVFVSRGPLIGPYVTYEVNGTVGMSFTPRYRLRMAVDANGIYVDTRPDQTGVTLQTRGFGNLDVIIQVLGLVDAGDGKLGIDVGVDVNFMLKEAANNKKYLLDIHSGADLSTFSTVDGLPAALNGDADWLNGNVLMQTLPGVSIDTKNRIYFMMGVNNPGPAVIDAALRYLPPEVRAEFVHFAEKYRIGEQVQNLIDDIGGIQERVCEEVEKFTDEYGFLGQVINTVSEWVLQCNDIVKPFRASFDGSVIPLVDAGARAIGITPSDPVNRDVGTISDVPDDYPNTNPTFPDSPPDGIYHYYTLGGALSRGEYTWSWNVDFLNKTYTVLDAGYDPQPSDDQTDNIQYEYDTAVAEPQPLIITGTDQNDTIIITDAGDGKILVQRWSTVDGVTFETDPPRIFDNVSRIIVDLKDGNDVFHMDPSITIPVSILGGAGEDDITTGNGNDYVDGGPDADVVKTNGGRDTLVNGNEGDVYIGGAGPDVISGSNTQMFGQDGNDQLTSVNGGNIINPGTGDDTVTGFRDTDRRLTVISPGTPDQGDDTLFEADGTPIFDPGQPFRVSDLFVIGADQGGPPQIRVVNALIGAEIARFNAFEPSFTGGVRVALGNVTGDANVEILAAPGVGLPPELRIFDLNGKLLESILIFEASFTGGLFVAAADVDGDGFDDIIVSPDVGGGPRVQILSGRDRSVLADFFAIDDPNFRGGVRIGLGDLNGDGFLDLIVGAGFGGGPRIAIFDGQSLRPGIEPLKLVSDFFAFEPQLRNGVFVAAGDLSGDGIGDAIFGAGPGGGPRIFGVDGKALLGSGGSTLQPVANFFAGNVNGRGGVRVTAKDFDRDGTIDLIVGQGSGAGPTATGYRGNTITPDNTPEAFWSFTAYDEAFRGGIFVG